MTEIGASGISGSRLGSMSAFGPASLSNLGPGFDAMGLCISGFGDTVSGELVEREPGTRIEPSESCPWLPVDPARNTAAVAARAVLKMAGYDGGLVLRFEKGVPLGSGIGGSAASAVAGAWLANNLVGSPFGKEELVDAVLEGESVASGSRHGDNVLPALLGGFVLVSPEDPSSYHQFDVPDFCITVVLPAMQVLTSDARAMLPSMVPLRDAVCNAADQSFLAVALVRGQLQELGTLIMRDRLVEPVRSSLVPGFEDVRKAALAAGAFGCALTGSGPAIFAISDSEDIGSAVKDAMIDALAQSGLDATGSVVHPDNQGVRLVEAEAGVSLLAGD